MHNSQLSFHSMAGLLVQPTKKASLRGLQLRHEGQPPFLVSFCGYSRTPCAYSHNPRDPALGFHEVELSHLFCLRNVTEWHSRCEGIVRAYPDQRTTNVNSRVRSSDPESLTTRRLQEQVEDLLGLFLVFVVER